MDDLPADIRAYHRRTKHHTGRYALGPAWLDWDSQPDPFRRFEGAPVVELPYRPAAETPAFAALGSAPAQPLDRRALGLFLELALGLSAWKEMPGARWSLRNAPSSGALYPTEGWLALPGLEGEAPGLFHYRPFDHALERRADLAGLELPEGCFLMAFSSVLWREAWKYGERAFRYCQHDVGHALACADYAAACLGWRVRALARPSDAQVAGLLGLDRPDAWHRFEAEHPDLVAVVGPVAVDDAPLPHATAWYGEANWISPDHDAWPVAEAAVRQTAKPETAPPAPWTATAPVLPASSHPTAEIIRARRSVQAMDGKTAITRDAFLRMLAATLPDSSRVPLRAFPWPPRVALVLFVHRVEGLDTGLYCLARDPDGLPKLKAALVAQARWTKVDCPLPLYQLAGGDLTALSSQLSCLQGIAGRGAFAVSMLAEFDRTLDEDGDWAYRRLFWECGLIGQVLYLEAVAAGVAGTGIGCFFDDSVHELLGLAAGSTAWQTLYHFTVGGGVEDKRIASFPAYDHLPETRLDL